MNNKKMPWHLSTSGIVILGFLTGGIYWFVGPFLRMKNKPITQNYHTPQKPFAERSDVNGIPSPIFDSREAARYYSEMEQIEALWSVIYNLKMYNSQKANEFEDLCNNNLLSLQAMLDEEQRRGFGRQTPPLVPAYKRLAMLYEKQENYKEAIGVCVEAIEAGAYNDGSAGKMYGRLARLIRKSGIEVNADVLKLTRQ